MNKIIILLAFSVFILSSCKKDSSNPVIPDTIPSAPVLLSPADTSSNVNFPLTFSWKVSAGETANTFQVAIDSSFNNLVFNETGIQGSTQEVSYLNYLTTYYWRVQGTNKTGNSSWSKIWRFTTCGALPTIPVLFYPPNGSLNAPIFPILRWNSLSGAESYTLQVSNNSSFNGFVYNQSALTQAYQHIAGLNMLTSYYWRVCATNKYGTSGWSNTFIFTTLDPHPVSPNLLSPSDNSITMIPPTLSWASDPDGLDSSYTLQVSTTESFTNLEFTLSGLTGTSHQVSGLSTGTRHFWRVSASNSYGTSGWSNIRSFTTSSTGNLYISSTPSSAQIWIDGANMGKITPDVITNLATGNHTVILKLTNYLNDTTTVNIQPGIQTTLSRTLVSDKSVTAYGPVQIWESANPTTQPNGIVLKTGQVASIGVSTYGALDIYYNSNGFVINSAYDLHNYTGRATSFFAGSSNNLYDGVPSPLVTYAWATQVRDILNNYFFLFDQDSHYSKMIITEIHPATVGDPGWVKVKWLYNNNQNDQRF